MNIAICDDDKGIIKETKKMIEACLMSRKEDYEIYTFRSGGELLESPVRFDIVFLDIEMPGISGLEVHKRLKERYIRTITVFITSYDHYMDDALIAQPFGFVSKPIDKERFIKIFEKLICKYKQLDKSVLVKTNDGIQRIKISDIIFVTIEARKVHLYTVLKEGQIEANESFEHWKKLLNAEQFCQIHQSYIVNMNFVKAIGKTTATLSYKNTFTNEIENFIVHISVRRYAEFKRKYFSFLGGMNK